MCVSPSHSYSPLPPNKHRGSYTENQHFAERKWPGEEAAGTACSWESSVGQAGGVPALPLRPPYFLLQAVEVVLWDVSLQAFSHQTLTLKRTGKTEEIQTIIEEKMKIIPTPNSSLFQCSIYTYLHTDTYIHLSKIYHIQDIIIIVVLNLQYCFICTHIFTLFSSPHSLLKFHAPHWLLPG